MSEYSHCPSIYCCYFFSHLVLILGPIKTFVFTFLSIWLSPRNIPLLKSIFRRSSPLDVRHNFHCSILFSKKIFTLSAFLNNYIHSLIELCGGNSFAFLESVKLIAESVCLINKQLVLCSSASLSTSFLFFWQKFLLFKIIMHLYCY